MDRRLRRLRREISSGIYEVDPAEVATAILAHKPRRSEAQKEAGRRNLIKARAVRWPTRP